jgi:inorganic triphosphatase YgiF
LRSAGVALRMRRVGKRWLQTAKAAGSAIAGLHERAEFEWPIAQPRLDPELLATTPWKKAFASAGPTLRPVFTTTVRRTSQPLRFADGTQAILCLDTGTINAGRRRAPIAEIEIELVTGSRWKITELAQTLAQDLPISVAQRSKAERGYALAAGEPMSPARAQRVALPADASAAQALAAVGADCLRQVGANAEALPSGGGDEFVHQLRVGVRRLRSLLKFVASTDAPPSLAAVDAELRWLGDAAGAARDCDVFATETLSGITPSLLQPAPRRDLGRLKARATRLRGAQHAALVSAVASTRTTRLLLAAGAMLGDLAALPGAAQAPGSARALAQATLEKRHRRMRKRGKHLSDMPAAERHQARIAAKKLRYAAEFFAPLYHESRAARYIDALSRLQDSLGKLNDIASAERLLDALVPAQNAARVLTHAAGIVRGWGAAASARELSRLDKAWRRFARRKSFWD